jgi:hypothetical protein
MELLANAEFYGDEHAALVAADKSESLTQYKLATSWCRHMLV